MNWKRWTKKEDTYLLEHWYEGRQTLANLGRNVNASYSQVRYRARALGLPELSSLPDEPCICPYGHEMIRHHVCRSCWLEWRDLARYRARERKAIERLKNKMTRKR